MRSPRRLRGFALVCLLVGCGDDGGSGDVGTTGGDGTESSSGPPMMNTAPTVVAQVDVTAACAMAGATRVELHATRVACIDPPPAPCTLPQPPRVTVGDGVDCPGDAAVQALRVELEQTGRYQVEVVTLAGADEVAAVCWGEGGAVEVLVDDARLSSNPTIEVQVLDGSPCG